MASTLSSPSPPSADPVTGSSDAASSFLPSLLIIAALLAFVLLASVSIHLLLRLLSRSSPPPPPPPPLPRTRREVHNVEAADASPVRRNGVCEGKKEVVGDEKQRLIESLPLFTMASSLAALPKSSPDCAVCLSPFTLDAELRLLPACPQSPPPPEPRSRDRSRSFRVEMGSVSNRSASTATGGNARPTYSLGTFDYHIDEEVEAVVSRAAPMTTRSAAAVKEDKPAAEQSPPPPGEAVAEAAGATRGWLREYVERLATSASSLSSFSGRWSSRWSQSYQSHHSHSQEEPWLWDAEAVRMSPPGTEEEETAFMVLYRWIAGV
ncbi:hypothetical protein OsJ_30770 [Oryza sativa Japonica Group]|uniref:Uncharacterized protein n=1 Tax=Oryza sativa subsp. japonica TaxID=39947 RepID=B9G7K7_ORYSJ|nr:hypothetical protein OsJ_30770 [Oryza sativa Japonica Group]